MKTLIANLLWKIYGMIPTAEMANKAMDMSPKLYNFAMWNHSRKKEDEDEA